MVCSGVARRSHAARCSPEGQRFDARARGGPGGVSLSTRRPGLASSSAVSSDGTEPSGLGVAHPLTPWGLSRPLSQPPLQWERSRPVGTFCRLEDVPPNRRPWRGPWWARAPLPGRLTAGTETSSGARAGRLPAAETEKPSDASQRALGPSPWPPVEVAPWRTGSLGPRKGCGQGPSPDITPGNEAPFG